MKKVLYLSNIQVPYRVRFFNELAKYCDLTVLYERQESKNRDKAWSTDGEKHYGTVCLKGVPIGNENAFSFGILKHIIGKYDAVILGCYNSPVQAMAIMVMRLLRIPYCLNVDGEVFLEGKSVKTLLKKWMLSGAAKYLAAGERSAASLEQVCGKAPVMPYYFSSLSQTELENNSADTAARTDTVLVVGQFFDYKGMDVALEAAKRDPSISYKFVGMGKRTELFRETFRTDEIPNVEIIPFLQKKELEQEYRSCSMLVLPSRQECWGLVINEAASFGVPIVSTWGSGAAAEFIGSRYPQYLAQPGDPEDLLKCIQLLRISRDNQEYSDYLKSKSQQYSIEKSVQVHLQACEISFRSV